VIVIMPGRLPMRLRTCTLIEPARVSDCTGAAALLGRLPAAEWLIADRRKDAGWFRKAMKSVESQRETPLNPGQEVARQGCPLRLAPQKTAQSRRDHVLSYSPIFGQISG